MDIKFDIICHKHKIFMRSMKWLMLNQKNQDIFFVLKKKWFISIQLCLQCWRKKSDHCYFFKPFCEKNAQCTFFFSIQALLISKTNIKLACWNKRKMRHFVLRCHIHKKANKSQHIINYSSIKSYFLEYIIVFVHSIMLFHA